MIVDSPDAFRSALQEVPPTSTGASVPSGVFMVLPERFRLAAETSDDNRYMNLAAAVDPGRALRQAEALAAAIRAAGLAVDAFPGREDTPDAVFPNNVFGTAPGAFIVGRMRHPGRRREALRQDIREHFMQSGDRRLIDLSQRECIAELTGPMVIDRARRIGFCGMSTRVDDSGLEAMHEAFGLALTFRFDLVPGEYHTNVVLSVLASRACVLFPGAFADMQVPQAIAEAYPGRTLFLDEGEKDAFAANCIALTDSDLFMSRTAADALRGESREAIQEWGFDIHAVELDEFEKAGGSLRCMVAEIY